MITSVVPIQCSREYKKFLKSISKHFNCSSMQKPLVTTTFLFMECDPSQANMPPTSDKDTNHTIDMLRRCVQELENEVYLLLVHVVA